MQLLSLLQITLQTIDGPLVLQTQHLAFIQLGLDIFQLMFQVVDLHGVASDVVGVELFSRLEGGLLLADVS